MRITSNQLRKIIMEEVSSVNRQKRLQERKRLQQRRRLQERRRIQEKRRRLNRRRMMESAPYPSFTHPKEQLIAAGIILAAAVVAGQLNKAFDLDGSQARKAAEEACEMTGGKCNPEDALKVAKELLYSAPEPQSAGEDVPYEDDYSSGEFMSDPSSYSDYDY